MATTGSVRYIAGIAVVVACLAGVLACPERAGAPPAPPGGTFRVISSTDEFDFIDPALAYRATSWALLDASCTQLLNYPDAKDSFKRLPVPEAAVAMPTVSKDAAALSLVISRAAG